MTRAVALSPGARKRGRVSSASSGGRTTTLASALPKRSTVQATAISRSLPENSGTASGTVPWPSASSITGPANSATVLNVLTSRPPICLAARASPPSTSRPGWPLGSMRLE